MLSLTRLKKALLRTTLIACTLAGAARSSGMAGESIPKALLLRSESKPLEGTSFDVETLGRILKGRVSCGVKEASISKPDELSKVLTKWSNENRNAVSANAAKDTQNCRIAYYRGPLALKTDGGVVLCLGDSDSYFPLADLLEPLSRCADKHPVLLVLDATSGINAKVMATSLEKALKKVPRRLGVIVVEQDQKLWNDRSRTNYWLCHGLSGQADADGDSRITFRELVEFVSGHVNGTGTVVTHVDDGLKSQMITHVRPATFDELLEDVAEGLALQFHDAGTRLVALPELEITGVSSENADLPGRPQGVLARYCLAKLKRELDLRSWFRFQIVDDERLRAYLNDNDLGPDKIQSPAMRKVGENIRMAAKTKGDSAVAVVLGTIEGRSPDEIALSLTTWNSASGAAAAPIAGKARINASEWAMLGKSAVNTSALTSFVSAPRAAPSTSNAQGGNNRKAPASDLHRSPDARQAIPGGKGSGVTPVTATREIRSAPPTFQYDADNANAVRLSEVEQFEASSRHKHPSLDPELGFPFRVKLAVEQTARNGTIEYVDLPQKPSDDGREVYVELTKGQNYIIRVENTGKVGAFMRLLVDGLNTLPDVPLTQRQGLYEVALPNDVKRLLPAQIASLNTARPWFCDPAVKCEVRGFFTDVPEGSKEVRATLQKFEVTDASTSEAARKKYLKDIGIVTAAFYAPGPQPLSMGAGQKVFGTKLGAEQAETVQRYDGDKYPCELLGVVHIRYGVKPLPD